LIIPASPGITFSSARPAIEKVPGPMLILPVVLCRSSPYREALTLTFRRRVSQIPAGL